MCVDYNLRKRRKVFTQNDVNKNLSQKVTIRYDLSEIEMGKSKYFKKCVKVSALKGK